MLVSREQRTAPVNDFDPKVNKQWQLNSSVKLSKWCSHILEG